MSKTKKNKTIKIHKTHKFYKFHKNKKSKKNLKNKSKNKFHITQHHSSNHLIHKLYDRKSDILKFQYTPKLRGGKFIDKGGFGCVISPALACNNTDTNLDKSVSKIIKRQSDTFSKELKIHYKGL